MAPTRAARTARSAAGCPATDHPRLTHGRGVRRRGEVADGPADVVVRRVRVRSRWLGRTRWAVDGRGRIRSAEVELNARWLTRAEVFPARWLRAEVAAHELLHALGAGHRSSGCTLMLPFSGISERCRRARPDGTVRCGLFALDVRTLAARYGRTEAAFEPQRCTRP